MAQASYPADLKYHSEHEWARIEGDEATFGITWYAQDSLGEVVFFEPPAVAALTQDDPYTEVESVKAVSDVVAPLSGQVVAVNEALKTSPRRSTRIPTARLAGAGEALRPRRSGQPARRRGLRGDAGLEPLHVGHGSGSARDAPDDRRRARSRTCSPTSRVARLGAAAGSR